ncbi:orotate phosphoribosyltransferase [Granulicatella balaenopterae]|uniref:Orotate phosphoribosyltransferase n=1 Tax=Granulicatella balaenopterae TaxID=137733 RepID=A0A1H9MF38_9LACT|nr:orotate phosphoribosyltransferase [Granulicatella balaenopterae]SER22055.1 orotate phosphoribosyltransferase [Granulicatella balaenopterae]
MIEKDLLAIKAVALSPENYFTWTSGIKSPIYCDNRLTMSYPTIRRQIASQLATLIKEQYPDVEMIAGTATAGIPHAAWVSELLDLPMTYVRSSAKKHGKTNQIEGVISPGQKVVVVEDLISTGLSSIKVVKALEAVGAEVLGVVAIFSYELTKAKDAFQHEGIGYHTLGHYDRLIEVATEEGYIEERHIKELINWRNQL